MWRSRSPSNTTAFPGRRSSGCTDERGGRSRFRALGVRDDGRERRAEPSRATEPEAAPVRCSAPAAPPPPHHRGRLARLRRRRGGRHRPHLPQRSPGRGDHRHRHRRHHRPVDERHRPAGPRRPRPGRELRRLVLGHRDHELGAHRGADRLPAVAPPGDLPAGVVHRGARAADPVRPDHPAPTLRRPVAGELGRLVAAFAPDVLARRAVGDRPLHPGARGETPQPDEVGGRGPRGAGRAGPAPSRRRLTERDRHRRPHRGQLRARPPSGTSPRARSSP